jgi:hypothetical protein
MRIAKVTMAAVLCLALCPTVAACSDKAQEAKTFARAACNKQALDQAGYLGQKDVSYFVVRQRANNQFQVFSNAKDPAAKAASKDPRWNDLLESIVDLIQSTATIATSGSGEEPLDVSQETGSQYNNARTKYEAACAIANAE